MRPPSIDADTASARSSAIRQGNVYGIGLLLVMLLAAAIVLAGVMGYEFLFWDDNRILLELQSRNYSPGKIIAWLTNPNVTYLFTPVSVIFFGSLADVFGVDPLPFHAAGVFLHLLNTFLAYLLILRLFTLLPAQGQKPAFPLLEPLVAAAAAGLWGMHLLRAEVIGWVAALPYALSTALALLAVHAFISSSRTSAPRFWIWVGLVLYSLSTLAHPQTAALCVVFLALDYLLTNKELSNNRQVHPSVNYFVRRHAIFFSVGLLVTLVGIAARSSSMNFSPMAASYVPAGWYSVVFGELAKLLGFISDFALFHTWLPRQVSNAYNPYIPKELFSGSFLASLLSFTAIVFVGIWRWVVGKKGLLLALSCHIAFCIPAAGLFMPDYSPSDRFTYGLAIIAAVPLAFALRSFGDFAAKHLGSSVPPNVLSIGLAGITSMLLVVCLSKLVAVLPNWKNTHTLMVHVQNTAPSKELYFFAKLRDVDYFRMRGDIPQMKQVLLSFLDAPRGKESEALINAIQYLIAQGRCVEAYYLTQAADAQLVRAYAGHIDTLLRSCR